MHISTRFISSKTLVLKTRRASLNCSGRSSTTGHSTMITGVMSSPFARGTRSGKTFLNKINLRHLQISRSFEGILQDSTVVNSKQEKNWTTRVGNDRHLMCIEDPFETDHDLGRRVDRQTIRILREEFQRAAVVLQHNDDPCVTLFEPYEKINQHETTDE